jgi:formiminotetrahydrofolate cyclodeaminase
MAEEQSIWTGTLSDFQSMIAAGDSITGAVAVSAVSAALAVSVLQMVLEVTARKRNSEHLQGLIGAARAARERLACAADEDRAAYASYRDAVRLPKEFEGRRQAIDAALQRASETPLAAARAATEALGLCVEAGRVAEGAIAADVGGAAHLLAGAIRAILTSVDANLRKLEGRPFHSALAMERRDLEVQAGARADQVVQILRVP